MSSPSWGGRATRAEVNLDALAQNVRALRTLSPQTRLMAVVKANAYGHGAQMAAKAMISAGADRLGVYTVDEGVALRRGGIESPILVFGPFERAEAVQIWRFQLTPTVTSLEAARWLQEAALGLRLPFHVKLDTGLTRAGIAASEAISFMRALRSFPVLEAEGIYTHFASADEPIKETTRLQLQTFLNAMDDLSSAGFSFAMRHAANSAATLSMPPARLDMVRTGISLYGYYPWRHGPTPVALRPALRLVSRVSRVREVPAGTGVGYGHEFRCARPSRIALVPIGYGDGLDRSLGNGRGTVIVQGQYAPIVGRVSMDQITIDTTDIPMVHVGDTVTIIGDDAELEQSADRLADQAGTISYEVLTTLLPRVPRLYVRDGQVVGTSSLLGDEPAGPPS